MTKPNVVGILILGVVALGLPMSAVADSIVHGPQNFDFPLSPGSETLSFPQFDDLGGALVLEQVIIEMYAEIGSDITAENDSSLPAPDFAVNLTGWVTADAPGMSVGANMFGNWPFALAPTDGTPDFGDDYNDFGYLSDSDSDSDQLPPGDMTPYIGLGTVDVDLAGSAGWSFSGTTDATLQIDDLGANGWAKITYVYTPEPATLMLLGLGALALRRR